MRVVLRPVRGWHADDGCVCNSGVFKEEGFELGGGDLVAFHFDEFLFAVDDEEVAVRVHIGDVSGFKPSVRGKCLFCSLGISPVAFHNVRASCPQFATGIWSSSCDLLVRFFVHDHSFAVRVWFANGI